MSKLLQCPLQMESSQLLERYITLLRTICKEEGVLRCMLQIPPVIDALEHSALYSMV